MASHEQIQSWDTEHVIHPWSFAGPSLLLVRGEGSSYFDADGREYLDALGGIQLCEIGHGRAELLELRQRARSRARTPARRARSGRDRRGLLHKRRLGELRERDQDGAAL